MWCINLSNLATGILWFLVLVGAVGVICLTIATCDRRFWIDKLRNRVFDCEHKMEMMKIDVDFLKGYQKESFDAEGKGRKVNK